MSGACGFKFETFRNSSAYRQYLLILILYSFLFFLPINCMFAFVNIMLLCVPYSKCLYQIDAIVFYFQVQLGIMRNNIMD